MAKKDYTTVLTIAGSDSGGCAGIQADLRIINQLKCHGVCAIAAITAQNTVGVQQVFPLMPQVIIAQLGSIGSDIKIDAIKIGMLFNEATIEVVAEFCKQNVHLPIVIDPVSVASSGDLLLLPQAIEVLKRDLLPLATIITPNLQEASTLFDFKLQDINSIKQLLENLAIKHCLITGGDGDRQQVQDIFFNCQTKSTRIYNHSRISTNNNHGSGCSLSTAIACYLAKGLNLETAIANAIEIIRTGLKKGAIYQLGMGAGPLSFY